MTDWSAPARSAPWRYLDPHVSDLLRPEVDQLVVRVAEGVTASVFTSAEGPKFSRDLRDGVRVAVTRFLDLVGTADDALTPQVREVFRGLGAAEARENRELEILLAALRVAARLLLRATADALTAQRQLGTDEVLGLADAVTEFIDELAAATADGFASQVRAGAGERDRLRTRLADMLVDGGASDVEVSDAAAVIGWPRLTHVVPVLLPIDETREARFRLGDDGVVSERGDHAIALVRTAERSDRASLEVRLRGRGAVVGPAVHWTELGSSIRLAQALSAHVGPVSDPRRQEVSWVDDHLASLALRGERAALALLERRWLAPFDAVSSTQADVLLTTLHAWLRNWGSRSAVADELFIHPQTVSYRIRRARDLLGRDLDDPDARHELTLVLSARYT